jgi:hypothetical protein
LAGGGICPNVDVAVDVEWIKSHIFLFKLLEFRTNNKNYYQIFGWDLARINLEKI